MTKKTKGHRASIYEVSDVHTGQLPKKGRFYLVWWIGPHTQVVGLQLWNFRINLHHDNWKNYPNRATRKSGSRRTHENEEEKDTKN